jgi:hypothetical protein
MMHQVKWMKLRAFKPLRDAGASWAEIARAAGCGWRTARKYSSRRDVSRRCIGRDDHRGGSSTRIPL